VQACGGATEPGCLCAQAGAPNGAHSAQAGLHPATPWTRLAAEGASNAMGPLCLHMLYCKGGLPHGAVTQRMKKNNNSNNGNNKWLSRKRGLPHGAGVQADVQRVGRQTCLERSQLLPPSSPHPTPPKLGASAPPSELGLCMQAHRALRHSH